MKTIALMKKTVLASLMATTVLLGSAGMTANMAMAAPAVAGLPDFADIVDKTGPAVVNIRTTQRLSQAASQASPEDEEMQEFFRRFFGVPMPRQQPQPPQRGGRQQEEVPRGVGSGFVISSDGYLLTNAHVVDGASDVYVTLRDKREFKAKVVGADKRTDVALLKVEANGLPVLKTGDSDTIRAGEWVLAIGSPFGLENTVTAGIVSAKSRDTGDYLPLIQTDVAVNPGNSGGPLLNMRGEVIGINSQIYSRSGGFMGISFAVPIDEALRVSEQLKTTGRVVRGRIGVQIGEVTKDVAETLGMKRAEGALVHRVEAGGPAEKSGVEAGDIIVRFNGQAIEKASDLPRLVGSLKPGAQGVLSVWRKGQIKDLTMTIVEAEQERAERPEQQRKQASPNALGLVVTDLTPKQKKELQIENGVVVESATGPAANAGLQAGDIVQRLNDTDVVSTKQFNGLVSGLDRKKRAAVLVRRGDASQFVPLRPNTN